MNNQLLLNPKVREMGQKLIDRMYDLGYEVDVQQGYRSIEQQDKLYSQGRTKPGKIVTKAKGGDSFHNYGLAIDVVFKKKGEWSWAEEFPWALLGKEGKKIGFEWGGDWKNPPDRPHFQYTKGYSLDKIKLLYKQGKLTKVWGVIC